VTVVREALAEANMSNFEGIDALAVTKGPGLIGALLVTVQVARSMASVLNLPLFGIHHLEGHLLSAFLNPDDSTQMQFEPHLALLVSGGHTQLVDVQGFAKYRIVGTTRDDAAGEAFDKGAKMLGLGYPGGPAIDAMAKHGDPAAFSFPRAMMRGQEEQLEFSFSGLKTALRVFLETKGQPRSQHELCDICASYQQAIVDVLTQKTVRAQKMLGHSRVHIVGGVAANGQLRRSFQHAGRENGFSVHVAAPQYCGDNAAMIAAAAAKRFSHGYRPSVEVFGSGDLEQECRN